ncbi:MAG TPA: AbrB/MazE/SpoVT family DNA-binding domain-containing protein [Candidatus Sulfotelmatobacter sp.]|nr:AbrB/MazE/SpoVT family DNA-binding domain-containing protein [Candidatus Sulfotelmatobacter sp.]
MPKVTSKLQLTVPKVIAEKYGIRPGDELEWTPAGESIRVRRVKNNEPTADLNIEERLALFDENSKWLDELQAEELRHWKSNERRITRENRGWTREELYGDRGLPRRH